MARASGRPLLTLSDFPWLAAAVLAGVALRMVWLAYVNVDPNDGRLDDSTFYHNVGRGLAAGAGYVDPWNGEPTAHWPPGYPAALAAVYKVFWWDLLWAKALNVGFAALTIVLVYVIGRRIFDQRVACLGALIVAFFPGHVYFATLIFSETMFAAVFMLVLFLALVWTVEREDGRWWHLLILGLLVGAAGMVRAEAVFLAPLLVGVWAFTVRPWRKLMRYAAVLAAGTALALTPWTVRNAVEFHDFIPLRADAGGALAQALDPDAPEPGNPQGLQPRSPSEGLRYQLAHPSELVSYAAEKLQDLYQDDADGIFLILTRPYPQPGPGYQPPMTEGEGAFWSGLANRYFFAAGAAALAAAAFCLLRRQGAALVLLVPVAGWTLLFSFFNPVTRYHFPLIPIIGIMSAGFLVLAWDAAWLFGRRLLGQKGERRPARVRAGPLGGSLG